MACSPECVTPQRVALPSMTGKLNRPRPQKTFGMGRAAPACPHRWYLSWGIVCVNDGDETGDYDTAWAQFWVWIGRAGKPTINLWKGRRKPWVDE